jgi:ubiquinone biosynthesis protein
VISVVSAVKDLGRLREITAVLVRHGFGEIVTRVGFGRGAKKKDEKAALEKADRAEKADKDDADKDADLVPLAPEDAARGEDEKQHISRAERVRLVLQDLGPSFIKLGQIASTRPDVIPADIIAELKKLQDDVPPVPSAELKAAIEASLGRKLEDVFVTFEDKPLATASIGQVHRAVLRTDDGDVQVVVKVQRPGVGSTVVRDLELLHMLAAAVEGGIPESKIYSPVGLVQQFDRSITSELNFLVEADNCERFAKNFAGHKTVRFPKVYRQASSKNVLTLEFFDGRKVDKALAAGFDGKKIAKNALGVVIKMIFEDGFFHADPHPGNIIILGTPEEPILGMIDVGMVGRLSPELRDSTIDLMVAAVRKDTAGVADALYTIGRPTKKVDMREYRAEVSMLAEKYLGKPLREIELSAMIRDLVQGAIKYGLEIPTDFLMVGKSLMTIEGIGKELDPDLDVFGEASPHFFELLKQRYSPQRLGNELIRGATQLSRAGYDMPMQLREVLDDLRLGRLTVRADHPQLAGAGDRLGRRVFTGLVVAALIGSGALLVNGLEHETLGAAMIALASAVWLGHVAMDLRRKH